MNPIECHECGKEIDYDERHVIAYGGHEDLKHDLCEVCADAIVDDMDPCVYEGKNAKGKHATKARYHV